MTQLLIATVALAATLRAEDTAPPPASGYPPPQGVALPARSNPLPLTSEQMMALVLVRGDEADGSGFVAKLHDQFFIVTNQHVLSGNKKFTLTGVDGTKYPTTGALFGARDYDVAILQIPENLARHFLEIESDALAHTKAGDLVTVPGNADATGVPSQSHGKLVGVGPEKVEVTAKFVHGNSGSPIIYRPTGKVIGIATEAIIRSPDVVQQAANASANHWLGYRLDNIPDKTGWIKLDWARFSEEGGKLQNAVDVTEFMIKLLTTHKIPSTDNTQLTAVINTYRSYAQNAAHLSDATDYAATVQAFVNRVHGIGRDSLKQLSTQTLYPYHAQRLQDLKDAWVEIDKAVADNNKVMRALIDSLPQH